MRVRRREADVVTAAGGAAVTALCAWAATGLDTGLLRKLFGGFLIFIGLRELLGRETGKNGPGG